MYCLCSDESHDDIMEKQRLNPLPFERMIETYTGCAQGCGSCIPELRERFEVECCAAADAMTLIEVA